MTFRRSRNRDNFCCLPALIFCHRGKSYIFGATANECYRCKIRFLLTLAFSLIFSVYSILGKLVVNLTTSTEELVGQLGSLLNYSYPDEET